MEGESILAGIGMAILVCIFIYLGVLAAESGIVDDCRVVGEFRHGKEVYSCFPRPASQINNPL